MTLLLPNSSFLHIPKTGGTWVRNAMFNCGLIVSELRSVTPDESTEDKEHSWHCVPKNNDAFASTQHVFCFVRNPYTWYQSYWAYKSATDKWRKHKEFDSCGDDSFNVFIDNVIDKYPDGYVTWMYNFFVEHATFVGKMENLQNDLVEALSIAGEQFYLDDITKTPRAKVSSVSKKRKAVYTKTQIEQLYAIEEEAIHRYGYNHAVSFLRFK